MYVDLEVRSNFSFLQGASPPERLVRRAAELGFDAIALSDVAGIYGVVRAMEACEAAGVRLIVGCELGFVLLHVENHAGYTNLCRVLTHAHSNGVQSKDFARSEVRDPPSGENKDVTPLDVDFLAQHADGLWCTALPNGHAHDIAKLKDAFGARLSLAVRRLMDGEDAKNFRTQSAFAEKFSVPLVATGGVRFAKPEEKPVLDVLYCIRNGITLDDAGRALLPNAERCLRPENAVRARFTRHPELLERTRVIADACRFSMRELRYHFPCEIDGVTPGADANALLRKLTFEGAHRRWGETIPEKVRALLEKELALIADLEVAPYFLSVWDVVEMARKRDILCQGRGSAANSAVCFCLGITAVDPSRSSLLFERFLSPERKEPPDIDVDFEHERREEVIQDIYAKYGRDRAAMVSEVVSYRGRSALREVGKAFGLSLEQVERLSGLVSWWDGVEVPANRLRDAGFDPGDERTHRVLAMSAAIQGFPRHLSVHVGGFVLSATPLVEIAPVQPATMPGRTVVPWDKDDIDMLGFFKMDVLGLGILTAIRKSLDFVQPEVGQGSGDRREVPGKQGSAIDRLARVPSEDPRVYDALCNADTVGVFQIESRAQMSMLPRLRPRGFYDLVIEVAIVRPGPIQGGMVHPYLRRRNKEEAIDYPHPSLVPILERTLGVPLFQEQVMQIAIVGAGYTPGEADQLRRDMAAWRRNGRLERHRERLRRGFLSKGISEEFAERLYAQIQGFGEYGFPECVVGETLIVDAATGRRVPIEDLARGRAKIETTFACSDFVSARPRGGDVRLQKRRVLKATCSGKREVFRLRTASGKSVTATADHPLLTQQDWQPLESLANQRIAVSSSTMEIEWETVVSIERVGMRETFDLTIEGDHNFLANDIVVHNSHSSSFALLVYSSAWLKVHHPAAFAAALVNSQPMGFYTPSTIFEDAKRHGVTVHPPCIAKSGWDCSLENARTIRIGLRLVKGLGEEMGRRIEAARRQTMFDSIEDLAARGGVGKKELAALAESGALETLAPGRRNALWKVVAPRSEGIFTGHDEGAETPRLPPLGRTEQLVLDFERTGTSPDHPMKLVRPSLPSHILSSRDMVRAKDGQRAKTAGMVICRQRPGTASGVVFMTLEDELGFVNLVLWSRVFEHLRHVATTSPLVIAEGLVQREGSVVHLVVQNMRPLQLPSTVPSMSRDFH